MFASILEGYSLMIIVLLHLSLFTCDENCIYPLRFVNNVVSKEVLQSAVKLISMFPISKVTLQTMAQLIFMGDIFVLTILSLKLIGNLLKKFTYVFISLAISAFILQRLKLLWNDLHLFWINYHSFSISSCLPLVDVLLFGKLLKFDFPSIVYVIQWLKFVGNDHFCKVTTKNTSFQHITAITFPLIFNFFGHKMLFVIDYNIPLLILLD